MSSSNRSLTISPVKPSNSGIGRQEILRALSDFRRQSLDRSKFWNLFYASEHESTASRSYSQQRLAQEAAFRAQVKQQRQLLMTLGTERTKIHALAESSAATSTLARANATLTTILRQWTSVEQLDRPLGWQSSLVKRTMWSPWLTAVLTDCDKTT